MSVKKSQGVVAAAAVVVTGRCDSDWSLGEMKPLVADKLGVSLGELNKSEEDATKLSSSVLENLE